MHPEQTSLDWARQLLADETIANEGSSRSELSFRVAYEKLRQHISATIGLEGFSALAYRALTLSRAETDIFADVQVAKDGRLTDFEELQSRSGIAADNDFGVIVIAHLLGIFLSFLGEATTLRLIQEVFPHLKQPDSLAIAASFDGVLQEVNHLKSISEVLESLSTKHPAAEDGLLLISSNIRNIATVLDVFVAVRSASATVLETEAFELSTRYLM